MPKTPRFVTLPFQAGLVDNRNKIPVLLKKFQAITITVELLKEEALPLLRSLERLQILQVLLPENKVAGKATRNGKALSKTGRQPVEKIVKKAEPALFASGAVKPLRKTLTLDELLAEQNFKGFDRQEMDKLIAKINVQEPIEELLANA